MTAHNLDDLQTMMDDFLVISEPGVHTDAEYQKANALRRNQIEIARQLHAHLAGGAVVAGISADELVKLIGYHESYWKNTFGRGDVEAENANLLSNRIVSIAQDLIDVLKNEGTP